MDGYSLIQLNDMIDELGEDGTKAILSKFSCQKNKDVENFLKLRSIPFSQQGIAQTHLIFCQSKKKIELIAYFSLASKSFTISNKPKRISHALKTRLKRFGELDPVLNSYFVPAPLIAQLGKNFNNGLNKLITGDELLKLACDEVKKVQRIVGGKFVYLECEDKECLTNFYSENGFVNFGKRRLEKDEKDELSGEYLIQMLKYLR